jgi:hypothetical protein
MELIRPKFLALDTSTLAKLCYDYVSQSEGSKKKAQQFINELTLRGVHITVTSSHIWEFLRHENQAVAEGRIQFLGELLLLAWIRPYMFP